MELVTILVNRLVGVAIKQSLGVMEAAIQSQRVGEEEMLWECLVHAFSSLLPTLRAEW